MARNWSSAKRREQAARAARDAVDDSRYLDDEPFEPAPSKAELRAEAELAIAAYRGRVRRLPMYAALRCRVCGHRGRARVPPGASPRFKCSACKSTLVAFRL